MKNEKLENLIDTEDNITSRIVPCKITDILNYKVVTLRKAPENVTSVEIISIKEIIEKIFIDYFSFSAYNEIFSHNRQIITILIPKTNKPLIQNEIWKYVNKINFLPTLAYSGSYNDCPELSDKESFIFTYVLNQPIRDIQVIENIEKYLQEKVFADYNVTITDNIATEGELTELYVNSNIYVPVIGGVANV